MIGMRRNVTLLAVCQALMMSANALVGLALAEEKILATLPVGLQWIATMLTAIPAAMLMRRVGRRAGLMIGVMAAIIGGTLCTVAIFYRHFELFCVGSALVGAFNAFGQQYRFAPPMRPASSSAVAPYPWCWRVGLSPPLPGLI